MHACTVLVYCSNNMLTCCMNNGTDLQSCCHQLDDDVIHWHSHSIICITHTVPVQHDTEEGQGKYTHNIMYTYTYVQYIYIYMYVEYTVCTFHSTSELVRWLHTYTTIGACSDALTVICNDPNLWLTLSILYRYTICIVMLHYKGVKLCIHWLRTPHLVHDGPNLHLQQQQTLNQQQY